MWWPGKRRATSYSVTPRMMVTFTAPRLMKSISSPCGNQWQSAWQSAWQSLRQAVWQSSVAISVSISVASGSAIKRAATCSPCTMTYSSGRAMIGASFETTSTRQARVSPEKRLTRSTSSRLSEMSSCTCHGAHGGGEGSEGVEKTCQRWDLNIRFKASTCFSTTLDSNNDDTCY